MNITFNGMETSSNMVAFTNCPNILTVTEEEKEPLNAEIEIDIIMLSNLTVDNNYYIDINGHKIYSVWSLAKETGTFYLLVNSDADEYIKYTCDSIIRALRNVKYIDTNYDIYHKMSDTGGMTNTIILRAKEIGPKFNIKFKSNLPAETWATRVTEGTSSNQLAKGRVNKINVDVYRAYPTSRIGSTGVERYEFVTTLSKNYVGSGCSFNMSPVFASIAKYNELSECSFMVYSTSDNRVLASQQLPKIFLTTGYLINQGVPFIAPFTNALYAANVSRGKIRQFVNSTILYIYYRVLPIPLFTTDANKNVDIVIKYVNSAGEIRKEKTMTLYSYTSLQTFNVILDEDYSIYNYIDVDIANIGTIRYNVIKPVTATSEFVRIYWTNSYGGTSFFDFVGERTENRKVKHETYQTQLFDYYNKHESERDIVFDKNVEISVNVKTHNIEKDGQWVLFDLENSTNAWTVVNEKLYKVIITDLSIQETSVKDVLTATVTYQYSLADTF